MKKTRQTSWTGNERDMIDGEDVRQISSEKLTSDSHLATTVTSDT